MNLPGDLLALWVYWLAHGLYLLLMGWALISAPWYKMREPGNLNIFLAATVGLLFMWLLKAGIHPGMTFHLLGATLLMLMFGWQFAIMAISLVLLGQAVNGNIDFFSFSINALLMAALPVLFSFAVFRLSLRYLPKNFFIYTLFNAYVCGALSMAVTITAASLLLLCCSDYTLELLARRYLSFAPLMIFAEGFITGMLATALVLFRPGWIGSFNDRQYLQGK
ncbi:MAG: energy-coupling factor ABC transporter permease [Chromatiales bacterium]|nr:energy-coupling factor ABC transporter permease [Gammaproteobacteria bacterium]MBW6476431.1 energy-coupling factor ABC transporter permease [Chromatiales bacterium]